MRLQRGICTAFLGLGIAAGNSTPAAAEPIDIKAFRSVALAKHNDYRARHGAPSLVYSDRLASEAADWAKHLAASGQLTHSGKGGENLDFFWSSEPISAAQLAEQAVERWYNELKKYSYKKPGFSGKTGHFTQVVWKSSTSLGCGAAQSKDQAYYVVCRYDPPGNVLGQFPANVVRPISQPAASGHHR